MKLKSWSITWITKITLTSTTWWKIICRFEFEKNPKQFMKLNSWSITWITKIILTSTTWWKIIGRWLRKSSGATTWTRQLSYKLAKHKYVHFHFILCGGGSHQFLPEIFSFADYWTLWDYTLCGRRGGVSCKVKSWGCTWGRCWKRKPLFNCIAS